MNMFFSIIIPTYNRKDFLKIALFSVLAQRFKNFEVIIVDDGSTDGTQAFVKQIKDKRVKYLFQENKGPSSARNLGIKKAQNRWLCFLDSDDRFRKEKLTLTYEYIKRYPAYRIFHTEEIWYRNQLYLAPKKEHTKPQGWIFPQALKICCLSLSTACIHKNVFKKIGLFDEKFPVCEDYEFWLRATLFFKVKLIPEYLTIKEGGHPDQQSQRKGLDRYRVLAIDKIIRNYPLSEDYLKKAKETLKEKARIYIEGAKKRKKLKEAKEIEKILKRYGYRLS